MPRTKSQWDMAEHELPPPPLGPFYYLGGKRPTLCSDGAGVATIQATRVVQTEILAALNFYRPAEDAITKALALYDHPPAR